MIRPELSSPAHIRIQGGSPERDGGVGEGVVARLYFPFLILDDLLKGGTMAMAISLRRRHWQKKVRTTKVTCMLDIRPALWVLNSLETIQFICRAWLKCVHDPE